VGVLCVTMGWWWKREGEMREEGMMGWRGPVVGEPSRFHLRLEHLITPNSKRDGLTEGLPEPLLVLFLLQHHTPDQIITILVLNMKNKNEKLMPLSSGQALPKVPTSISL
jgi:hypothetical protein